MSVTAPRTHVGGSKWENLPARKKTVRDSMLMHKMSTQEPLTSRRIPHSGECRRSVFSVKPTDREKHDYFTARFVELVEARSRKKRFGQGAETVEVRGRGGDLDRLERQAAARVAVSASTRTGDILPRRIYELAGEKVPKNATDTTQRKQTFLERVLGTQFSTSPGLLT